MADARTVGMELAPFILRVALGISMMLHGAQKLDLLQQGSVQPKPFAEMSWSLTADKVGIMADTWAKQGIVPASYAKPLTWAAAAGELLGGLLIALGLFTRVGALLIAGIMAVAVWKVHGQHGYFLMNHGFEYNALILAACAYLLLAGPGKASIDALLTGEGGKGKKKG